MVFHQVQHQRSWPKWKELKQRNAYVVLKIVYEADQSADDCFVLAGYALNFSVVLDMFYKFCHTA